jgi:hypothetical protein
MEGSEPTGEQRPALSEEEARAAIEEQLAQVRVQDLLIESVVGILNLTARRIAKPDERDLEQGKLGIDAVRAVIDLLPEEPQKAVRDALAELQMLYAREAHETVEPEGGAPTQEPPPETPPRRSPEAPPRLWTPGS